MLATLAPFALSLFMPAQVAHDAAPVKIAALAPAHSSLEAGRYSLVLRYTIDAELPLIGKVKSSTTTTALVDLDAHGAARQRVCSITSSTPDALGVSTRASPSLVKGIPEVRYVVSVADGARISADLGPGALGYDADKTHRLPESGRDPAVTDPDGDGVPGAAIDVHVPGMGRLPISIVSQGHTTLDGRITAPGRAEGRALLDDAAQRVVAGLPFAPPAQSVVPDARRSHFELVKIDGNASCADVVQRATR
jgi:hypothetical protein